MAFSQDPTCESIRSQSLLHSVVNSSNPCSVARELPERRILSGYALVLWVLIHELVREELGMYVVFEVTVMIAGDDDA